MSLTRRSFIKKSSYSAAAVSILGTGHGIENPDSAKKKRVTDKVDVTVTVDTTADGEGFGTSAAEALNNAIMFAKLTANEKLNSSSVASHKWVDEDDELKEIETTPIPPHQMTEEIEIIETDNENGFFSAKVRLTLSANSKVRHIYKYGSK